MTDQSAAPWWKTIGFWCAMAMAVSQAVSAARAFADPVAFASYMGLPIAPGEAAGFVTVYALRTTLIAALVLFLALTGRLRELGVMAVIAILLPVGDAMLVASAGAPPSTVYRHAGIAVFLTFTAIMLLRDSRRLKA